MEWKFLFAALLLLIIIYVRPFKLLFNIVKYSLAGLVFLFLVNLLLAKVGMHIAINPFTVLMAGFFNIPGIIFLVISGCLFL